MKKLIYIFLVLSVLSFTACLKDIPAPDSHEPLKLAVNLILRPGEHPAAELRMTNVSFQTPDYGQYYQALKSSEVLLYKNGAYLTSLKSDSLGFYHTDSTITIEANANYTFSVEVPQFGLSASGPVITVPTGVTPSQISFIPSPQRTVELTLPKDAANRYILLHISLASEDSSSSYPYNEWGPEPFASDGDWIGISQPNPVDYNYSNVDVFYYRENADTAYNDSTYISYSPASFAFDAMEASGSEVKIKIRFKVNPYDNIASYKKMHIQTVSVTKDYFEYVKSAKKYGQSNNNPFSTPVQVYTNINNGYGIFGAAFKTTVWIDL
jgi:hypothetical protein